jgi:hypothetical protein
MRPRGDPDALAAAARMLAAAAAEMARLATGPGGPAGDFAGPGGPGGDFARPGGWQGRASTAYRARERLIDAGIRQAADVLRQAGAGLSELSAGLSGAQALWDHAGSLAASAGLALDPGAPDGPLALPLLSVDPRATTAARVAEIARDATEQAVAADRAAAARLAEAAAAADRAGAAIGAAGGRAAAGAGAAVGGGAGDTPGAGAEREGRRGESEHPSLLARGLAVVDRIGVAVGAGLAAIEARAAALTKLVRSGSEPAASLAAVRALAALERTAFTDALVTFLPLGGPAVTLAANLVGAGGDEPLARALVRSLGESLGADVGQRIGMVACGVETFASEGAGVILCPAATIATASLGARLGGAAAVFVYDELGAEPSPHPASTAAGSRP